MPPTWIDIIIMDRYMKRHLIPTDQLTTGCDTATGVYNLLADLWLLVQGQTEAEHGLWIAIEVDVVHGIQVKGDHMVHDRDQ